MKLGMLAVIVTFFLCASVFAQSATIHEDITIYSTLTIEKPAELEVLTLSENNSTISINATQNESNSILNDELDAPLCWGFEGVISTAAKTPDYYTITAYYPGTSSVVATETGYFTFPTPCDYSPWSPVWCAPITVDVIAVAYNAQGHCIGKDFGYNLTVSGLTGSIEIDFYCD